MNDHTIIERGPWQAEVKAGEGGIQAIIMSEDFTHDAWLYLEGCATLTEADRQARAISAALNHNGAENADRPGQQVPWCVHWHINSSTVYLCRQDPASGIRDTRILRITGDFGDDAQKMAYAREIAARLNRAEEDQQATDLPAG